MYPLCGGKAVTWWWEKRRRRRAPGDRPHPSISFRRKRGFEEI